MPGGFHASPADVREKGIFMMNILSVIMLIAVKKNNSAIQSPKDLLMAILVLAIIVGFMVGMVVLINFFTKSMETLEGKNPIQSGDGLTPTQGFILAASSPTIGREYKCVIDIWHTRDSEEGRKRVQEVFTWGWGKFTIENVRELTEELMNREDSNQGLLGWNLVRVLSIVGSAYMGGIMEYEEAAGIALKVCRILQSNFSSWDEMVKSYTVGYQKWRGKKKKDRLMYYQRLKKTWVYEIDWNTELREEEL